MLTPTTTTADIIFVVSIYRLFAVQKMRFYVSSRLSLSSTSADYQQKTVLNGASSPTGPEQTFASHRAPRVARPCGSVTHWWDWSTACCVGHKEMRECARIQAGMRSSRERVSFHPQQGCILACSHMFSYVLTCSSRVSVFRRIRLRDF